LIGLDSYTEDATVKTEAAQEVAVTTNTGTRRSTRSAAGKVLSNRIMEDVLCSIMNGSSASSYLSQLAHHAKTIQTWIQGKFIFQT